MRSRVVCLVLAAAVLLAYSPTLTAQSQDKWAAVKALPVDARLIVTKKDGSKIEGRMIEATDTNLSLSRDKKVVNIPRADVQEIWHSIGKAQKGKWALIGAGAGAGAGAGIGYTKYDPDKDDYEIYPFMGALIGTAAGAVTGLLIGSSRRKRELIYQAF